MSTRYPHVKHMYRSKEKACMKRRQPTHVQTEMKSECKTHVLETIKENMCNGNEKSVHQACKNEKS